MMSLPATDRRYTDGSSGLAPDLCSRRGSASPDLYRWRGRLLAGRALGCLGGWPNAGGGGAVPNRSL